MVDKVANQQQKARKTGEIGWESPAFSIVGPGAASNARTSNYNYSHGSAAQPAHQL